MMMQQDRQMKREQLGLLLAVGIVFVLACIFARYCIWTHDDYMTRQLSLIESIEHALNFGNGRYLGNTMVDLILPHKTADIFTRGIMITAYVILVACVSFRLNLKTLSISLILTFCIGKSILAQVFVWGHGFYNFFPPVLLLLFSVFLLKRHYYEGKSNSNVILPAGLALVGLCQQLFSENVTCIGVIASGIILGAAIKYKKELKAALAYFIATATGAIIMFALPVLMGVSHKMHEYRGRGIGADSLGDFAYMVINNLYVCLQALLPLIAAWAFLLYAIIALLRNNADTAEKSLKGNRSIYIILFVLGLLSVGELLIITVMGPRCLFLTATIINVFVIRLIAANDLIPNRKAMYLFIAGVVIMVLVTGLYYSVWRVNEVRLEYIAKQMSEGKRTIEIINLPHEKWLHMPNESYAYRYYFNYGDYDEMKFTYIDLDEYR